MLLSFKSTLVVDESLFVFHLNSMSIFNVKADVSKYKSKNMQDKNLTK